MLFAPLDRPARSAKERKEWEDRCAWIRGNSRTGMFGHVRLADLFATQGSARLRVRCFDARQLDQLDMDELGELRQYLTAGGSQAWFEFDPTTNFAAEKIETERLANGFYLWASPFTARMRRAYRDIYGDPYNDLDDQFGEGRTLTYPATTGAPLSTPQWEAYREGVDDLRYITTLEQLIEKAKMGEIAETERKAAEKVLAGIRDEIDKHRPGMSRLLEEFGPDDYDRWRRDIASAIIALQKALPPPDER